MIQERLFSLQDQEYRQFMSKLLPTLPCERIIGVRTPALKKLAKELSKEEAETFLQALPHTYYEENNLHAFLIMQIRAYDACMAALNAFLPYVDNWATCDALAPKALIREPERLLEQVKRWLASEHTYTIRYGIGTLQRFFLDARFDAAYLEMVSAIRSEEYYVKMMVAWYFATALAKQYETALPYLQQSRLDAWTHKKTIRKAIESYRITPEQKQYLRSL